MIRRALPSLPLAVVVLEVTAVSVLVPDIRLAEQLERSRDGAIRQVRVAAHDGTVELDADVDPARDPSVPIWAARRNADLLAEAIGRTVEIG